MAPCIGIGGWDYEPWRGTFYPEGLPKAQQLPYAAGQLTSIEVNATFYRTQSADSFRRWGASVPPGFVFALKAPRAAAYGLDAEQVAASIARFMASGITELGPALGPILWQFPPTRRFDPDRVARFADLLPAAHDGIALRHAIEARHESFAAPAYAGLLVERGIADCLVETADVPARTTLTAPFAYLRLQANALDSEEGYDSAALDRWATWVRATAPAMPQGVHVYFIAGDKVRAPDSARALLARLGRTP